MEPSECDSNRKPVACEVSQGFELDPGDEEKGSPTSTPLEPPPDCHSNQKGTESGTDSVSAQTETILDEKIRLETKSKPFWKRFIGVFLALISAICFSLILVVVKLIPDMHPINQTVWRQSVATLIGICIALGITCLKGTGRVLQKQQSVLHGIIELDLDRDPGWLKVNWRVLIKILTIGLFVAGAVLSRVTALEYLTIGDATVATYLSLVFTLPLACVLLHEKCRITPTLMAALIITGAFVITRPPFLTGATELDTQLAIGMVLKLMDGLNTALYTTVVRKFREYHFLAIFVLTSFVALCFAVLFTFALDLFVWPEGPQDVALLVVLGILSTVAQNALILALKFESASTVALVRCSDVPFAFAWQVLIFNVVPDEWSILGTLLVCTGVLVTSLSKIVGELPNESETKKNLGFLLK